jgi:hypothetical protein
MTVAGLEIRHLRIRETCAKFFGLFVHVQDELRTIDSIRESPGNFPLKSCREAARPADGLPARADSDWRARRKSPPLIRRSRSDNDHFLHE